MTVVLALHGALASPPQPVANTQTVLYYNARLALREDNPSDAVKLWLLRNSVKERTQQVSTYDGDFESVTWVALTDMALCPDGLAADDDGAGLWPIALHNWVVSTRDARRAVRAPNPWQTLDTGRQSRPVSIHSVLGAEELSNIDFQPGGCRSDNAAVHAAKAGAFADLSEPETQRRTLTGLLEQAQETLSPEVRGRSVIDARLFDLQLASLGEDPSVPSDSHAARILQESTEWPHAEWMALSPERRLFLFDQARANTQAHHALDKIALDMVDALASNGSGVDVEQWIARCQADMDRQRIWDGQRGQGLLALDAPTGFQGRSAIAMHRGVQAFQGGQPEDAMYWFGLALQHATDSRDPDTTRALALRWLSYLSVQFELTDELLQTLRETLPPRDFDVILQDLLWAAALRADTPSFERGFRELPENSAPARRVARLLPLATGDSGAFVDALRAELHESPRETLGFITAFIDHMELEDTQVRQAHFDATLAPLNGVLTDVTNGNFGARHARNGAALQARIVTGMHGLNHQDASTRMRGPTSILYAGSVRLAPTDPLPWPFVAEPSSPPSTMSPLTLTPVEWRDDNAVVFGWAISE